MQANVAQFNTDYKDISESLSFFNGSHCADYSNYKLFSAFQPIYSIAHRRIVGVEGLLRAVDTSKSFVPPWKLFSNSNNEEVMLLDKLCQVIHIDNFLALDDNNVWIFLNVNPLSLHNVETFVNYLDVLIKDRGLPPHRIVIEILESGIDSEEGLQEALAHYKELGCLIAIDDFGAGHSNFERIWRVQPDIVKFDRAMVNRAGQSPNIASMMKGIVSLLHKNRCIVLAEGIENEKEAIVCMEANVDLVQGFYFCRPFMLSEPMETDANIWPRLNDLFYEFSSKQNERTHKQLNDYKKRFQEIMGLEDIELIAEYMFKLDRTIRLYKIAEDGRQNISNLESPNFTNNKTSKMAPLLKAKDASWQHRPYFTKAIHNPGKVQISDPYLSIPDGKICITYSVKIEDKKSPYVLCCDIYWDD
ncbi:MAG: EAL domain-containing protein [Gammaproteobacteria bacterium]|jgi:EAL domain-containing protein (putative c-di-GMP-specific phosphodiesterase class I)